MRTNVVGNRRTVDTRRYSRALPFSTLVLAGLLLLAPNAAEAVPSFARQTQLSCSACHTQPPRLTRFGQDFKMEGYTLTMAEKSPDRSILKWLPVSARIRGRALVERGDGIDGTRTRIELIRGIHAHNSNDNHDDNHGDNHNQNGHQNDNDIHEDPSERIQLFIAGRVTDHIGVFGHTPSDVRVAVTRHFGDTLVGVVGGHTLPGATDPFDTIGGGHLMGYTVDRDFIFDTGPGPDPWRRESAGANAFVYASSFYVAAGLWDYRQEGAIDLDERTDLVHLRVAYRPSLGMTDSHIGVFSQRVSDLDIERLGVDVSSQIPLGEDLLLDLIGVYTRGRDHGASHSGVQLVASLHRGPLAYGLQYATYDRIVGNADSLGAHVSYMVAENARLGLDLVQRSIGDQTTQHLVLVYDIAF